MKENLVRVFEDGRTFVMAKVVRSASGDEIVRALRKNGEDYNPTFKLTDGPLVGTYSGIAKTKIPDYLFREGDLGFCLVFGIGEVMHFSDTPKAE